MRSVAIASMFVLTCAAFSCGCGGRSMGNPNDDPDSGVAPDAQVIPPDAQVIPPDAQVIPPDDCAPQDIGFCSYACDTTVGWRWDGAFCRPVVCCCDGPDCDEMYATREECVTARLGCPDNTCAQNGGYCEYGDFVEPGCLEGYYSDETLSEQEPGVCGLGICCSPCLYPDDPTVSWVAYSPAECADIDWDCFDPQWTNFEDECGCGCYIP